MCRVVSCGRFYWEFFQWKLKYFFENIQKCSNNSFRLYIQFNSLASTENKLSTVDICLMFAVKCRCCPSLYSKFIMHYSQENSVNHTTVTYPLDLSQIVSRSHFHYAFKWRLVSQFKNFYEFWEYFSVCIVKNILYHLISTIHSYTINYIMWTKFLTQSPESIDQSADFYRTLRMIEVWHFSC